MTIKSKKFKKILWAGKNKEDGSIAYNWMHKKRWEAVECFKKYDHYKIVKVELMEV